MTSEIPPPPIPADYESTPITRQEYISAIVHLYRGEMYRATAWRIRLDNTTNWAVLTTAGLLSLSFGSGAPANVELFVGVPLISVFWAFESRRYRYADIWQSRVRKIEENFYGPILRRDPVSPEREWGQLVAKDLFRPRFKITRFEALRARFLRNYWTIFCVLLLAWMVKILTGAHRWEQVRARLELGPLPWWVPFVVIVGLLSAIALLLFTTRHTRAEEDHWNIPT